MSPDFGSKCARASAARNLNPVLFIAEVQLKKLDDAVLDRDIATSTERSKSAQAPATSP
jgi:hypothetical protein